MDYKYFTIQANKTSTFCYAENQTVYAFKTPKNAKFIFNEITVKNRSAINGKHRFYWDTKIFAWVTLSKKSADEANQQLRELRAIEFRNSKTQTHNESYDFLISQFDWQKKTDCLVAELSDLGIRGIKDTIAIKSHKTGKIIKFTKFKTDTDGEDTFGWHYKSSEIKTTVLLIND